MRTLVGPVFLALLAGCASSELSRPANAPCDRVASLASAGEHKPAVDEMAGLQEQGVVCPKQVLVAVEESRARLVEADAYLHGAQRKKQRGDLVGAKEDLLKALEIYPKYYWAERQRRDLEKTLAAEVASLKDRATRLQSEGAPLGALEALERASALAPSDSDLVSSLKLLRQQIAEKNLWLARRAEGRGDLAEAARRIGQAMEAESGDPDLRRDIVEYARLLGLKFFSDGELTQARDLWRRALPIDDTNQKLRDHLKEVEKRLKNLEEIKTREDGSGLEQGHGCS